MENKGNPKKAKTNKDRGGTSGEGGGGFCRLPPPSWSRVETDSRELVPWEELSSAWGCASFLKHPEVSAFSMGSGYSNLFEFMGVCILYNEPFGKGIGI